MKICLHTFWDITHDFIGGTERFLIELSKELRLLGFQPFIVCTGDNVKTRIQGVDVFGIIPEKYRKSFSEFGEAKLGLLDDIFVRNKTTKDGLQEFADYVSHQLDHFEYDVVHLNSFASSIFFKSTQPVIVTNHENRDESDNLWGYGFFDKIKVLSKLAESSFHKHYALAVPSKYYSKEYSDFFDIEILGINQGVNLSEFERHFSDHQENRYKQYNVLLPSRLEPEQKGHDLAIQACKILADAGITVKMVFSGIRKDNLKSVKVLRAMAKKLDVAENIEFKTFANRVMAESGV